MIDAFARNPSYLYQALEDNMKNDELIQGLVDISKKVNSPDNKNKQTIHLGLYRHDFMMCNEQKTFKLVEWNTIACSIATFSDGVRSIYDKLIKLYPELYSKYNSNKQLLSSNIVSDYTDGLSVGVDLYCKKYNLNKDQVIVLCVVDEEETNLFDIYNIQDTLRNKK